MSFKLGNTAISTLKLGSTAISKAYLGSTLVFGSTGPHFQVDTGGTMTNGLLFYGKMEDASDFWGTNNGTATNTSTVAAKVNDGQSFNGSSSSIEYGSPFTNFTDDFTIAFYIYALNGSGTLRIIYCEQSTTRVITIGIHTNNKLFIFYGNGANYSGVTTTTGDYVICKVGGTTTIYKDNSSLYSFNQDYNTGGGFSGKKLIGAQYYGGSPQDRFNGTLDEIGIWNRALTTQERIDRWNSGNIQTMVS